MLSGNAPLVAHVYTNGGSFKRSLTVLDRPELQSTIQSAGQPVTLLCEALDKNPSGDDPAWGDKVTLTQQSLSDSGVLYTGIIEDLEVDYGTRVQYALNLQPIGSELGDTYYSHAYTGATDPAQMVRDAVAATTHLTTTTLSCPNTSALGIYNFSNTTCLEVLNIAKLIAGVTYWWHVDSSGVVWFQAFNAATAATYTVKMGQDYTAQKFRQPIGKLKNRVLAVGAVPPGGSVPRTSTYSDAASQTQYGVRSLSPPLNFPTVDDQATLDACATTVGTALNRRAVRIELTLPNFPLRLRVGQAAPTIRYWEPATTPTDEGFTGRGGYSPNYLLLDVRSDGVTQTVTLGDIPPVSAEDFKYELAQIIHRTSIANLTYVPASLNVIGQINGGGIQTSGTGTARWIIDGNSIRGEDGSGVDYGGGTSVTAKIGADGSFFGAKMLLQSRATGARMKLDASVPLLTINDGTRDRVQVGLLSSYTDPNGVVSAADYGGRFLDSSGDLLVDTQGLSKVAADVASYADTAGIGISAQTSFTDTGAETGSFTIPTGRSVKVLVLCQTNVEPNITFSHSGTYTLRLITGGTAGPLAHGTASGGTIVPVMLYQVATLAAGTYTAKLQYELAVSNLGDTGTLVQTYIHVIQLGN